MKPERIFSTVILNIFLVAVISGASDTPEVGVEYKLKGTKGGPMLYVPAGEFMMGCNGDKDKKCKGNEKPYHQVYLDAYYIDKYEVTNREYEECVNEGACTVRLKPMTEWKHPVTNVRWEQALAYCHWAKKRLPTEAEWEKAARGNDGRIYPSGNDIDCSKAHYGKCKPHDFLPIGSLPDGASPYGAMDMAGNAWEWTNDWYKSSYYKKSPKKNPQGPKSAGFHSVRGGSWKDNAKELRVSRRMKVVSNTPVMTLFGFRCAKTPDSP